MTYAERNLNWVALEVTDFHLKAWLMNSEGGILDQTLKAVLHDAPLEGQIIALLENWLVHDVVIDVLSCGWPDIHVPKLPVVPNAAMNAGRLHHVSINDHRLRLHDVLGLRQTRPNDVLRSESTSVSGYIKQYPKFDGVLCIVAKHSKWVRVSAEEVVSFESYVTGEMIDLMTGYSSFQTTLNENWDWSAFDEAFEDAISKPEKIAARIAGIKHDAMLNTDVQNTLAMSMVRSRLSGLFIGAEVASTRPYWLGQDVVLCGNPVLCDLYNRALIAQGCMVRQTEIQNLMLIGLAEARRLYLKQNSI
jgi:2-dehydro-3-deoxygalactonokinase